jgi:hypothetical protein
MTQTIRQIFVAVCALALTGVTAARAQFADAEWATGVSAPVAADTRASFGGLLARGTVLVGDPAGGAAAAWDTVAAADGWHLRTAGGMSTNLAVLNSPDVAVEEGRLSAGAVWGADRLHLLRHSVAVPAGVTLTVQGGAVLKFTENAQLVVEDGGTLELLDSAENRVVFARAEDDTLGGDTDMQTAQTAPGNLLAVRAFPSATVRENGYGTLGAGVTLGIYPDMTLHDAVAMEQSGRAYVPVTVEGTRGRVFSIDWVAEPGTAAYGADYTALSGTVTWATSASGTGYIEVPLAADAAHEAPETFTVRVVASCGVNVISGETAVTVLDASDKWTDSGVNQGFDSGAGEAAPVRVDARDDFGSRLANGAVPLAWSTLWAEPAAERVRLTAGRRRSPRRMRRGTGRSPTSGSRTAWRSRARRTGRIPSPRRRREIRGTTRCASRTSSAAPRAGPTRCR